MEDSTPVFNIGDTVELKSGSHVMTVQAVDATGVLVVWFDEVGTYDLKFNRLPPGCFKTVRVISREVK